MATTRQRKIKDNSDLLSVEELTKLIRVRYSESDLEHVPESEKKDFISIKLFPIDILIKADWNYKEEDEYTSMKLRNNIQRNGQTENTHVRLLKTGYYEVVNGNHRLDEFNKLGKKYVYAYDHGEISLLEAQRIAIETNETHYRAQRKINRVDAKCYRGIRLR